MSGLAQGSFCLQCSPSSWGIGWQSAIHRRLWVVALPTAPGSKVLLRRLISGGPSACICPCTLARNLQSSFRDGHMHDAYSGRISVPDTKFLSVSLVCIMNCFSQFRGCLSTPSRCDGGASDMSMARQHEDSMHQMEVSPFLCHAIPLPRQQLSHICVPDQAMMKMHVCTVPHRPPTCILTQRAHQCMQAAAKRLLTQLIPCKLWCLRACCGEVGRGPMPPADVHLLTI